MKHEMQTALVGVLLLTVVSLAAAQQSLQPVVRSGDWIEIANETFMNIIAAADIRYHTTHNYDFESKVRDRAASRAPGVANEGENDLSWAELRWGADFRYQKNLTMQILFEHQSVFDGALIDDRSNTTNPGGTDIFGNAASGENPGFHVERYWIDYAFPGAKVHLRVGADLWYLDQAGLLGGGG